MRNEERYLPGFLHHIRDHVDGIVALDDCSSDRTLEILRDEPRVRSILREENCGAPHANETKNRYRLIAEAAKQNANWVICADADERYEDKFLRRLPSEIEAGERSGQYVRLVRIVNLWNSRSLYRVDGLNKPRWTARMFKIPDRFSQRSAGMHQPWFPAELENAPRAHMNAYLYHLKTIEQCDREARFEKFVSVDPDGEHQAVGYGHIVDETNLELKPVLHGRSYKGAPDDISSSIFERDLSKASHSRRRLTESEFDELFYLNQNLDVQQAVLKGEMVSGWHHFEHYGKREGRGWRYRPQLLGFDFDSIFKKFRGETL